MDITNAARGRERLEWLDVARGIGIILVVFGHVMRGLADAGIAQGAWVGPQDFVLYTFHMPLFFFLAGLTVRGSIAKGPERFVKSKLHTVAYPYFLWSAFQGAVLILVGSNANNPITFGDLLATPWRPISQFWFLWALFACHMLFLVTHSRRWLLIAAGAVSMIAGLWLSVIAPDFILTKTFYNLPFFVLGAIVAPAVLQAEPRRGVVTTAALWLGFAAAADGALRFTTTPMSAWAIPAALLGIAGTICFSTLLSGAVRDSLAVLGRISMTIYVIHILAASGTRIILLKYGIDGPLSLHLAAGMVAGIGFSMIAHLMFKQAGLLWLLGLSPKKNRPAVGILTAA